MPRVVAVRIVWRIWIAFTLNDFQEAGRPRFGLSEVQAQTRAACA